MMRLREAPNLLPEDDLGAQGSDWAEIFSLVLLGFLAKVDQSRLPEKHTWQGAFHLHLKLSASHGAIG